MTSIFYIRKNHQNGIFLIDATEVKQIAVLSESHASVSICRHNVVTHKNSK